MRKTPKVILLFLLDTKSKIADRNLDDMSKRRERHGSDRKNARKFEKK